MHHCLLIFLFLADQIFYRSYVDKQHFRLQSFASLCPNNGLTETCSLGLLCASLILDIHIIIGLLQEGGVNLLAQLWDCAADDLSHYDVTSEPVREISMAA